MDSAKRVCILAWLSSWVFGCQPVESMAPPDIPAKTPELSAFDGSKAGDEREVAGITLCWCPPGRFTMGSPRGEPERRPGEDQVEVTLTRGFWMATAAGGAIVLAGLLAVRFAANRGSVTPCA